MPYQTYDPLRKELVWVDGPNPAQSPVSYNQKIIALGREALQAYRDLENDLMIPEDSKPQLLVEKKEEYRQKLVQLSAEAKKAAETAKVSARVAAARQYFARDQNPYEIAADEQTFRRVKSLLDAGVQAHEIIEDAANRGDMRTIATVEREAPAYFWSKGQREVADGLTPFIDQAKYQTGSESYRAAADEMAKANERAQIVAYNASAADQAIKGEHTTFMSDDGTAINTDDSSDS